MILALAAALAQEAVKPEVKAQPLGAIGWTFMILSVGFVVTLTFWCFYRVLTSGTEPAKQVEEFHSA